MTTKFLVTIIINIIIVAIFMYIGLGPLKFLRKIISPDGDISWTWFFINSLIILLIFAFIVSSISIQIKSTSNELTRNILKEELSNVLHPPELEKLREIAKNRKTTLQTLLTNLEKGDNFDKGIVAIARKKYSLAAELLLKNAKEKQKQAGESWFFYGNAQLFKGDYKNASEGYQSAAVFGQEYAPGLYNNWGLALINLNYNNEAIEKFRKAI